MDAVQHLDPPAGPETQRRRGLTPVRALVIAIVVVFAVMWIYAWFFAPSGSPMRLTDATYGPRAEAVCAAAEAKITALPMAKDTPIMAERVAVLDEANGYVDDLVEQLAAIDVDGTAKDRGLVDLWIGDWRGYAEARRQHADELRAGIDSQFAVKEADGVPVTERMDGFSDVNQMPSCEVPLDV